MEKESIRFVLRGGQFGLRMNGQERIMNISLLREEQAEYSLSSCRAIHWPSSAALQPTLLDTGQSRGSLTVLWPHPPKTCVLVPFYRRSGILRFAL